jgi:hypothetical protein
VGYGDGPPATDQTAQKTYWLVRKSTDGGQTWSTADQFNGGFSARATAVLSTPDGLLVAGSGWDGTSESGERWLVRKGTPDGTGGFQWKTVDEFQLQEVRRGFVSRPEGLAVDAQGNCYAVGRSYAGSDQAKIAHWIVRRASSGSSDWITVDTFQLHPGSFAAAESVTVGGPSGVYVVGRALDQAGSARWIVRQSATGNPNTWSVSDDFQPATALLAARNSKEPAASDSRNAIVSPPLGFACGQAILAVAGHVLAAGSAGTDEGRALLRRLEIAQPSQLAARPKQ